MADMQQIADKLMDRTADGTVVWKALGSGGSFAAVIGNLSVIVASERTNIITESAIKLSVLDEKGTEIDSIQHGGGNLNVNPSLIALHQAARRSALAVDDKLEELLASLSREST